MRFPTLLLLAAVLFISSLPGLAAEESAAESLARLRALGQAYMEQDDFANAIQYYQKAAEAAPQSAPDRINLGIAQFHNGDNDLSIETLTKALELDPQNPYALYILGLAYKKSGDNEKAADFFRQVVGIDPSDIPARYNLGLALAKSGKSDAAIPVLEEVIRMDPKHSAAIYNLSFAVRPKDPKRAGELLKKFAEVKKLDTEQKPTDYVDEGKYYVQITFDIPREDQPKLTSDLVPSFVENAAWTKAIQETLETEHARVLAVISNGEQKTNGLIIAASSWTVLVTMDMQGKVTEKNLLINAQARDAYPVDYDNDVDTDILLYTDDNLWLLKNDNGVYSDVSSDVGIVAKGANDAFWADFDHEGDLDLFLANPTDGDKIYQNNGDGSFKDVSGTVEGLELGKSYSVALADLDNDNDLDLARLSDEKLEVFENLRQVRFRSVSVIPEANQRLFFANETKENSKMEAHDVDNDGHMEIVVLGSTYVDPFFHLSPDPVKGELNQNTIYSEIGKPQLPSTGLQYLVSVDIRNYTAEPQEILYLFDANNDGYEDWIDKGISSTRTHLNIHQHNNLSKTKIVRETEFLFGSAISIISVDLDFDNDLDLLLAKADQTIAALENTTGNQNRAIALDILGKKNATDGYGSKVEIKDGLFYVKKEVNSPLTHLGIGNRDKVDVLRLTWPNGIFQNIISATAQILSVSERPGYAGSCPFVYTWNGEKFEFVADALSTGPVGLYVGGGFFPSDPDEYIRVRGDQLKAKDGKFDLRFKEELREITYLDELELLSVTHPLNVPIYSHECFTTPPHPEFKLIGQSSQARPPRRVIDQQGNDVTDLISGNDNRYPRPFDMGHYEGVGNEYAFEIDLNDLEDTGNLYLFMTGYVDWPNSSVARSLEQNPSLDFVMPYVQVKNEKGEWETVINPMGFPAGKLKTAPLKVSTLFKSQDRTLRIVSTLQVHWDRIWVDPAPILDGFVIERHPLASADFYYGGYSKSYDLNGVGPHWYDYAHRESNTRWDYIRGFFTRYGDVLPLLQEFDDQYVIMGPGDEVAVQFNDTRKEPSPNTTYFVHLTGWVKDADYSTAFGTNVEPLPYKGMGEYHVDALAGYPYDEEHIDYLMQYNTRLVDKQNEPLRKPETVRGK